MGSVTSSAEQEAIRQAFRDKEGVDPLSTATLRLNADSMIQNISAMQQAITQIEFLQDRLTRVRAAVDGARQALMGAGMQPVLVALDEALKV